MSLPIIGAEQHFALWAVLLGLAGFGFWCEKYSWGRKYSGIMLLISLAIVLANLRIIPTTSPTYDAVWNNLVPIAIPLLLFQANLRKIVKESGPILVAFILGGMAVVCGALLGVSLLDLGENEAELAGIFSGTYIGGGLNFAAVADSTNMQGRSVLAAAVAADNVITNLHFLLIIFLPGVTWLTKKFPEPLLRQATTAEMHQDLPIHHITDLNLAGLLGALSLAFIIAATGHLVADWLNVPQFAILIITAITLVIATSFPEKVGNLSGHKEAGAVMMSIFLASVGASADIWQLIEIAPILFVFAAIIVSCHLVVLFVVGRLMNFTLAELAMASAVCIGGPASAAALASTKGWQDLLIPGVLAGSFGYAIGSFVGVSVFAWLQ